MGASNMLTSGVQARHFPTGQGAGGISQQHGQGGYLQRDQEIGRVPPSREGPTVILTFLPHSREALVQTENP